MSIGWLLLLLWVSVIAGVFLFYGRSLRALWREPVLRHPVLIIESDDWGAGPVELQAVALQRLMDLLSRHRDQTGRHPVMTLAVVLAIPDGKAIRADGHYHRLSLEDPRFEAILAEISRGCAAGVFAVQLHGLEHYWPAALMASSDPEVRTWLEGLQPALTEQLPAHLQSRWVDASALPSRPLPAAQVAAAVAEEVAMFQRIFKEKPRVAVPPTFVWNDVVENAWTAQGIAYVVTPGLRSACRNAYGLPDCDLGPLRNAQGGGQARYLVRDDYFEPERGHRADMALAALDQKWAQRRPCLLETHRSNFIRSEAECCEALEAMQDLLARIAARQPSVRFMTTAELGDVLCKQDPAWVEYGFGKRLAAWQARLLQLHGFRRWARLTGIGWLLRFARYAS